MPTVKVLNQEGSIVKDLELNDEIFGVEANMQVVYDVVNAERAAMRQGTHDTKGRTEVSGGGRKPWRQKGTGRARQGTIRAPQWRGGGIVFGPTPRSYAVKCNKKAVKLAKKCLLSNKLALNKLVVVDQITMEGFKTKDFAKILGNLNASGKIVVALDSENTNVTIASNNIPNVYVQNYSHLSVYDLINADMYILTEATVKKYEEELK
jgi:large subunit ribosomal protein L4